MILDNNLFNLDVQMTDKEEKMFLLVKSELQNVLIPNIYSNNKIKHAMYGHCHHASLALYKLLGGKDEGYKLQKAIDELGIIHYWLINKDNLILDVTAEQYTDLGRPLPYCNKIDNRASYRVTKATKKIIDNITNQSLKP